MYVKPSPANTSFKYHSKEGSVPPPVMSAVKVTWVPVQITVSGLTKMVAVGVSELRTSITIGRDVAEQPESRLAETVTGPEVVMTTLLPVLALLHRYEVALNAGTVRVTDPPIQNVKLPVWLITGTGVAL